MKIYIGSSFTMIPFVEELAQWLEDQGHEITEKWWCRPYQVEDLGEIHTSELKKIYDTLSWEEFYGKPETRKSFRLDYQGVTKADLMIYQAGDTPRKYNGATLEAGIAVAQHKPVLLIGELETSVMFSTFTKVRNYPELKKQLELIQSAKEGSHE